MRATSDLLCANSLSSAHSNREEVGKASEVIYPMHVIQEHDIAQYV